MIFLSESTFLGGDDFSGVISPTDSAGIYSLNMSNNSYDAIYITQDTTTTPSSTVPSEWNFSTVLYAPFTTDAEAGNVSWSVATVSNVLIKRKLKSEYDWITIQVKDINALADFTITGKDITPGNGTYEYAVVPIISGAEGTYSSTELDIEVTKMVLADADEIYTTIFTDGKLDITCNVPSSVVETMYNKYPTIISNTNANYKTVNINASFYPLDEESCDVNDITDDLKRTAYVDKVIEFLCNKKVKILKNVDGRRLLVYVTTPPSISYGDSYKQVSFDFGCTEVGDVNSEEDLYDAGILDDSVTEEWWN